MREKRPRAALRSRSQVIVLLLISLQGRRKILLYLHRIESRPARGAQPKDCPVAHPQHQSGQHDYLGYIRKTLQNSRRWSRDNRG